MMPTSLKPTMGVSLRLEYWFKPTILIPTMIWYQPTLNSR